MSYTTATCCERGRNQVRLQDTLGHWYVCDGEGRSDHVERVRFCPFCGRDLNAPATLEEALQKLLECPYPLDLCFDVDGVCADHEGLKPYADRKPYPWVPELMRKLKGAGHTLTFQTARYMKKYDGDQRKASEAGGFELRWWLSNNGIPYDHVYLGKASADIYVDDRGCRVESDRGTIDWCTSFVPAVLRAQAKKRAKNV